MTEDLIVEILFAASAIVAALEAFGARVLTKIHKIALAVCLAATAFFVQATDLLS